MNESSITILWLMIVSMIRSERNGKSVLDAYREFEHHPQVAETREIASNYLIKSLT